MSARRIAFLILIGGGGAALLLWLGAWQLDRVGEKQALIAEITAGLDAAPIKVAGVETAGAHNFQAARARGAFDPSAGVSRYLTTERPFGPGFRLISAFRLDTGARILVDRGYAPEAEAPRGGQAPPPPAGQLELTGVLRWPNETSAFTPDPNRADGLWFARDVPSLAAALDAAPVLLVLTQPPAAQTGRWPQPLPVRVDLPNKHLSYAITWFALAAIWLAMTAAFALRSAAGGPRTPPAAGSPTQETASHV